MQIQKTPDEKIVVRIDSSEILFDDLMAAFSEYFPLVAVEPAGSTVEQFWKAHVVGKFILVTKSLVQPLDGSASVHLICLANGAIRKATATLLKQRVLKAFSVICDDTDLAA